MRTVGVFLSSRIISILWILFNKEQKRKQIIRVEEQEDHFSKILYSSESASIIFVRFILLTSFLYLKRNDRLAAHTQIMFCWFCFPFHFLILFYFFIIEITRVFSTSKHQSYWSSGKLFEWIIWKINNPWMIAFVHFKDMNGN